MLQQMEYHQKKPGFSDHNSNKINLSTSVRLQLCPEKTDTGFTHIPILLKNLLVSVLKILRRVLREPVAS